MAEKEFDPVAAGQAEAKKNAKIDAAGITKPEMKFDQKVGTSEVTVPEGPIITDETEEKDTKKTATKKDDTK